MSTKEVFREAATYLSEHGHHKGALRGPGGTVCAIGAISEVTTIGETVTVRPGFDDACHEAGAVLKDRFPELGTKVNLGITMHPLAEWNDLPSTTGEDVILLFKELAHE